MRKKQVPSRKVSRRLASYEPATLLAAWDAVKGGMTIYQASQLFGIPSQTLRDRKNGKVLEPEDFGSGRHPALAKEDEQKLIDHIKYLTTIGYWCSRADIARLATDYSHYLHILPSDRSLTAGWFKRFDLRWPELKTVRQRATVSCPGKHTKGATADELKTYYVELKMILDKYELHDKPQCIYYMDETAIVTEPDKVSALKGDKSAMVAKYVSSPLTVVACGNAAGTYLPPFLIFKGKKKKTELSEKYSEGTEVRMSEMGWSDSVLLTDFVKHHFCNCTMGDNSDVKLLLYDGRASHINIGLIDWAREHKIILFLLPPSTKNPIQPSDVGCFEEFKKILYDECEAFMNRNGTDSISKYDLGGIVCMIYPKALSSYNLMSTFSKSGIYPFNSSVFENDLITTPPASNGHSVTITTTDSLTNTDLQIDDSTDLINNVSAETEQSHTPVIIKKSKKQKTIPPLKIRRITATKRSEPVVACSSKNWTSRKHRKPVAVSSDSDSTDGDSDVADEDKCCVCGHYEPDVLKHQSCLHLVNWAQCENCSHWVHLRFCVTQKAIRRHTNFLCPHCK
ncbi:uncharacterized protein LOC121373701 isoform X1 [Gigantopelta aegis]|uniref:uncharacterized protein LOC121373701 isoform X1 n=1 Tax=Gigantopelta aegis TaxID=1735272 RepID=UPI001B8883E2|nr:uncharacterized protein LOC121373701 isoform X1 [Gigantopelta aegis]